MRNPNGLGGVSKLSGNRRNPYCARVTVSWDKDTGKQRYKTIGYFPKRADAIAALVSYSQNPYDLDNKVTFAEIYDKWSDSKFESISESNVKGYKASYAVCEDLYKMKFSDIKTAHLQAVVDNCGKNYPTLRKLKVLFSQLYDYAMQNDVVSKDYSEYVDINKYKDKNPDRTDRSPFTQNEIQKLWDNVNTNEYVQIFLMLIYSGTRISELLDLKKENVNLNERWFDVTKSKTESGIRKVPIAAKTLPYFKYWYEHSTSEYLLCTPEGEHFKYRNYYDSYWAPVVKELGMESHRPHDTRHTCVSLLAEKEVSQTLIKLIVGHSGAMSLTERVYTHIDIQKMIDAIDQI